MHVLTWFVMVACTGYCTGILRSSRLKISTLCDVQNKFSSGCLTLAKPTPMRRMECTRICADRNNCSGVALDSANKCYILAYCTDPASGNCSQTDAGYTFYKMIPLMSDCKGTWIPTIRFCQCNSGYIGENCDTLGKSCRDLVGSYKVNTRVGSYLRSTFTNASYLTNCAIMDTGEIRTDFANFRVTVPFYVNRTWEEYVAGFSYNVGYLTPNIYDLWVGLDNMYYLYSVSRKPARMNVHLYFGGDTLGYVFIYYNINITDSSNNYKFSYGSFATNKFPALSFPPVNATNFTNCFSSKTTPGFSAPGRDNDDDPVNDCAKQSQGGWWISSCNVEPDCNPFGVPYNSSSDPITLERTRFKNSNIRDYVQYFSVIRIYLIESP